MKRLAILQSNYIPWKGYFDIIRAVDEVVLYDCCQYTKNDWRNRNIIKTQHGLKWLTIPLTGRGHLCKRICDMRVADHYWPTKHWKTLTQNYGHAKHFPELAPVFERLYRQCETIELLSQINYQFLRAICGLLGVTASFVWSMDFPIEERDPTERVVEVCRQRGADEYLSGPTARNYLRTEAFEKIGCGLRWMDYAGYPEHPQLHPPFEHGVSIMDLLFNAGVAQAGNYLLDMRRKLDACASEPQE